MQKLCRHTRQATIRSTAQSPENSFMHAMTAAGDPAAGYFCMCIFRTTALTERKLPLYIEEAANGNVPTWKYLFRTPQKS